MHVEPVLSIEQLRSLIRKTKAARLSSRYRAVLLAARGKTAKEIGHDLCVCTRSVQEWISRYNKGGPEALVDRPKSGQPKILTPEQEAQVSRWMEDGPDDPGLSSWNGPLIRDRIEDCFGKPMSLAGAYALLHRIGYEPLRPRPQHRKSDPDAMRAWEQRAPFLSGESVNHTPTKTSRSGSRTRRVSGNRAR